MTPSLVFHKRVWSKLFAMSERKIINAREEITCRDIAVSIRFREQRQHNRDVFAEAVIEVYATS